MFDSQSMDAGQRPLKAVPISQISRQGRWAMDAPRSFGFGGVLEVEPTVSAEAQADLAASGAVAQTGRLNNDVDRSGDHFANEVEGGWGGGGGF